MRRKLNYKKKIYWTLLGLIGLVAVIAVAPRVGNVEAQPASREAAVGTVMKPGKVIEIGPATERTPEDMAAAEAASALSPAGQAVEIAPFRPTMDEATYKAIKSQAAAALQPEGRTGAATPEPLGPPLLKGRNYDGATQAIGGGWYPPDTHGAVGLTHFVEVTNSHIDMYTKATNPGTLVKSVSLASFFGYSTTGIFDPRVVYDPTWNRWVVYAESFPETSTFQRIFFAISKTSNPTGAYWVYHVNINLFGSTTFFWDYGQLGMDQDAIFVTANIFDPGYTNSWMFAVAKASLYNGWGFGVPVFMGLVGTLAPPIVLDQNANAYFVAAWSGVDLTIYRGNNLSNAWWATLTYQASMDVPDYGVPGSAAQPGTAFLLDTLDGRFVNASTQYGDSLWNVHSIGWGGAGGLATPMFYEIDVEGAGANTVKQNGMFWAGAHDWNASIAANTSGEAFVTWTTTFSGGNNQAAVRFSGRLPGDAAGVIGAGSQLFQSPTFSTEGRWGDYSAVSLDPSWYGACAPGRRAWIVNEKTQPDGLWGSRIGRIGHC